MFLISHMCIQSFLARYPRTQAMYSLRIPSLSITFPTFITTVKNEIWGCEQLGIDGVGEEKCTWPGYELARLLAHVQLFLATSSSQTWLNNPTCITWKGEMMVAGDSDGMLFFFDSKTPSRSVQLAILLPY